MADNNFPTAYGDKQDEWKRRQAIIDAMSAGAMQAPQGRQAGRLYVAPSPLEGIAKVFQAYMANKGEKGLVEEKAAARESYDTETRKALDAYTTGRQTDPRQAAIQALMSQDPRLQSLGQGDLAAAAKGAIQPKDLLSMQDPRMIPQLLSQGTAGFSPKREVKIIGDIAFDPNSLETLQLGGAKPTTTTIGGDLYQQSPTTGGLKKLDNAPKVNVSPQFNISTKGEGKFMETLGGKQAEAVVAAQQAKQQGQQSLVMADRMEELLKQGVFTGPTANIAMAAGALSQALGLPGARQELANSEEFQGLVGKQAAQALTGPGGAKMTDKDMELFLSQFPQLTRSPQGIQAIINSVRRAAQQNIDYADRVNTSVSEQFPEAGRLMGVTPAIQPFPVAPQGGGQSGSKVMSLDDYLKAQGAR